MTQINVCKSPFPSAGTAVTLFRAKTVQQRPLLPREVETRIVGSHTRWELTTWADFPLCLLRLLMSTGCKSSHNGFLDVSRSNGWLRISGWIDVDVERKQAQAIASLPDSITHYYAYSNEDFTVISLLLPVPCNSERKLYMISWLSQNLSNLVLKQFTVSADTT